MGVFFCPKRLGDFLSPKRLGDFFCPERSGDFGLLLDFGLLDFAVLPLELSPKESVEGANTVLRGSVRAPEENPMEPSH